MLKGYEFNKPMKRIMQKSIYTEEHKIVGEFLSGGRRT